MKKIRLWGSILLLCLVAAFIYWKYSESSSSTPVGTTTSVAKPEIQGKITFHSKGSKQTIDVEVARSAYEHSKGLMDRTSLPHHHGMLFIFDEMGPRSFWMRNTRISLDIIYVDDKKKIVSIQKNTVPMSDESLPSEGPAQYVIEVNAGFSDLYGVQPGDSLTFLIP